MAPYLRGTANKKWAASYAKRPTLQNQITSLRRQVNNQKPETQWLRVNGTMPAIAAAGLVTITPLLTQIAATDFRDQVLGDRWKVKGLKMIFDTDPQVNGYRVVLYRCKRAGTTWNPLATSSPFTDIPDPTAFTVIQDRIYGRDHTTHKQPTIHNMRFTSHIRYDSNTTVLEAGDFKVAVIYYTDTSSGTALSYSYCMAFENK